MLILSKQDMQRVLSMEKAIETIKTAFRLFSEDKTIVPLRTKINVAKYEGVTLPAEAVKIGAHVNGVGSYMPAMQEIPPEIFSKATKVFVESRDAVLSEAGDLIIPINEGRFTKDVISGELGELVVGRIVGRESDDDITIFKTVGIGVQDVVTASEIYSRAKKSGVGTEVSF